MRPFSLGTGGRTVKRKWDSRNFCFAPDDTQGGGGGQGGDSDIVAKVQALIDKRGGDSSAVAVMLYQENFQLRDKNRQLASQVPAEGATVLTGDDAAAWAEYQKLGKPADLQTAIAQRDQAQGDLAKLQRSAMIRTAAEAAGYKPTVLESLDAQTGGAATYEVREVEQDGKRAKVAFVKVGESEAQPLDQYAQAQWADFLPALVTQPQTAQTTGTPYPAQQSGGRTAEVDFVAKWQSEQEEARKAVKNPLLAQSH